MDILTHIAGLAIVAAIVATLGAGLALLNTLALRLPLTPRPPVRRLLPVIVPAALWAGYSTYLLARMAVSPTAANLWPLTIGLMAVLWLGWIAIAALAGLLWRVRR